MNIPNLYNLNLDRTATYTETIRIDTAGIAYLTYIPKKDTLSVPGFSIIVSGTPDISQVYIDWKEEYDYIQAKGLLQFNTDNSGITLNVTYTPVASRVDAEVINKLILFYNTYNGNIFSKDDFVNPGAVEIVWENISGAPGLATEDQMGFIDFEDKRKLEKFDYDVNPIGSIKAGTNTASPVEWGGVIEFADSDSVKPVIVDNKVKFNVNAEAVHQLDSDTVAALAGTHGIPKSTNKFVTNTDTRLYNSRPPTEHDHTVSEVLGLDTELDGKADSMHRHNVSDLDGYTGGTELSEGVQAALAGTQGLPSNTNKFVTGTDTRLSDTRTPKAHQHSIAQVTDLQSALSALSPQGHEHDATDITGIDRVIESDSRKLAYVEDFFEESFVVEPSGLLLTSFGGPRTGDMNAFDEVMNVGTAYVNGKRIQHAVSDGSLTDPLRVNYIGPTVSMGGPIGRYPDITSRYALVVDRTYEIRVDSGNTIAGQYNGLAVSVRINGGAWNSIPNIQSGPPIDADSGLNINMYMGASTQYSAGDTWTSNVYTSGYTYVDINSSDQFTIIYTNKATPAPAVSFDSIRLFRAETDGVKVSAVVDLRPTKRYLLNSHTISPVTSDDSDKVATTEYVRNQFDTTTFKLNTTQWQDLVISPSALGVGPSAPALQTFRGGLQELAFAGTGTTPEQLFGNTEVLHDYKEGTDVYFHIHWSPSDAVAGNVRWGLEYSFINPNGVFPAPTTVYVTSPTSSTQYKHVLSELPALNGSGMEIGCVIKFRLFRDPADALDTYASPSFLHSIGVHYEVDTAGSDQKFSKTI